MTISGIENDKTSVSLTINTNGRCVIPQTLKSGESCFIGLKADSTLDSGAGDAIKAYSNLTTVAFSGASPADLTATTTVNTLSYIQLMGW